MSIDKRQVQIESAKAKFSGGKGNQKEMQKKKECKEKGLIYDNKTKECRERKKRKKKSPVNKKLDNKLDDLEKRIEHIENQANITDLFKYVNIKLLPKYGTQAGNDKYFERYLWDHEEEKTFGSYFNNSIKEGLNRLSKFEYPIAVAYFLEGLHIIYTSQKYYYSDIDNPTRNMLKVMGPDGFIWVFLKIGFTGLKNDPKYEESLKFGFKDKKTNKDFDIIKRIDEGMKSKKQKWNIFDEKANTREEFCKSLLSFIKRLKTFYIKNEEIKQQEEWGTLIKDGASYWPKDLTKYVEIKYKP